jgi:hypothetical protein
MEVPGAEPDQPKMVPPGKDFANPGTEIAWLIGMHHTGSDQGKTPWLQNRGVPLNFKPFTPAAVDPQHMPVMKMIGEDMITLTRQGLQSRQVARTIPDHVLC